MRTRDRKVDEPLRWLRANGRNLGTLTVPDFQALLAIARCWQLYTVAEDPKAALAAIGYLLLAMQPKCWYLAKQLIPWAVEGGDEDLIWRELVSASPSLCALWLSAEKRRATLERGVA